MQIEVLGSGSSGNCYLIKDGASCIMIDCGIPFHDILAKTNFLADRIDGCLVSHSHKDHIGSAGHLMTHGIPCYMSCDTYADSGIDPDLLTSRAVIITHGEEFDLGTFAVRPLNLNHDVPCLGFLIYSKVARKSLFFATDTYYIQYIIPAVDYIMIEANYDLDILNKRRASGETDMVAKDRLSRSHMSIDTAINWLASTNLSKCRRIYLMHLSDGSSDAELFKRRVVEATGVPVVIC